MLDSTFKLIITFIIGMASGAVLVVLGYLMLMLATIKKRDYIVKAQNKNIEQDEVLKLIEERKIKYRIDLESEVKELKQGALKRNIMALAEEIAKLYFPKSKRPLAELTIDEIIMLDRYIVDRVEEILDRPGLRAVKKLKVNRIIQFTQTKKKIEDSKAMQFVDKYKLKKVYNGAINVVNFINPAHWFKKLVVDRLVSKAVYKINLMIITISGQEIYKIYSRKILNKEEEDLIDDDIKQLETDLSNVEEV